jgi:hypothetical protein
MKVKGNNNNNHKITVRIKPESARINANPIRRSGRQTRFTGVMEN